MDKATGNIEDLKFTKVNKMYSELLVVLYPRRSKRNTDSKAWMSSLNRRVRNLKERMVRLFEDQ